MGKALLGHQVGDRVCIHVSDSYHYYVQIRKIEKTGEDPDIPYQHFFENSGPCPAEPRAGGFLGPVSPPYTPPERAARQRKGLLQRSPLGKSAAKPVPYPQTVSMYWVRSGG